MYSIWNDPVIWVVLVGAAGLIFGYLLSQSTVKKQISSAREDAKSEFEVEKTELSQDLAKELLKVRKGLIDTISAYRDAVQLVSDRLPTPSLLKELQELDGEVITPQLEMFPSKSLEPAQTSTSSETSPERKDSSHAEEAAAPEVPSPAESQSEHSHPEQAEREDEVRPELLN